jgi:hypothetical protein
MLRACGLTGGVVRVKRLIAHDVGGTPCGRRA